MSLPVRLMRNASDPVETAQRDFDSMLGRWFGGRFGEGALAPYGVDVREDGDHVYVEAELPGFKKDEIDISLENQMLTITAERRQEKDADKKGELLLHERQYTRYQRSFNLPTTVDPQSCHAKLTDGILTLTLEKRAEAKPRRVQVQ